MFLFTIGYVYLCSRGRNFRTIFLKFCTCTKTNILFCNRLGKFDGQNNQIIFSVPVTGVWSSKENLLRKFPSILEYGRAHFRSISFICFYKGKCDQTGYSMSPNVKFTCLLWYIKCGSKCFQFRLFAQTIGQKLASFTLVSSVRSRFLIGLSGNYCTIYRYLKSGHLDIKLTLKPIQETQD